LTVQAFPSLHPLPLFEKTQPEPALQLSLVQAFPSLHASEPPLLHPPPWQWSLVVHAFPSLHPLLLLENTHPDPELQLSLVHGFPSTQFLAPPPLHPPPWQWSLTEHAFPSSHPLLLWENTHPDPGLQLSLVHPLPSSHASDPLPLHPPPWH